MRYRLFGLVVAALFTGTVYAQTCCDTCSSPSCQKSWRVTGGGEALFLKPRMPNGDAFVVSNVAQDDRIRSFDFDYEAAPRLFLGVENCRGLGARVRYFYLDADAFEDQTVDLGANNRVRREINDGVFTTDVDANAVLGERVAVGTDLKLQALDIEVTQRLERNRTTFNFSGGVRWAETQSRLFATEFDNVGVPAEFYGVRSEFDGVGATFAAGLDRRLGCSGLSLIANTRASVIAGKTDIGVVDRIGGDYLLDDRYSGMYIGEVQVGGKYAFCLPCGAEVSAQATYEGQFWSGMPLATRMGENFSDGDDLFLDGFGFGLGLMY